MTFKRAIIQLKFWSYLGNGYKRSAYARKKKLFNEIGENVSLPMTVPLYPQLVRIHNNVIMHHSVKLITHDRINAFLGNADEKCVYEQDELLAPIEIMDNVYVGMNVIILGNVKIGSNVIINAGSVVSSDIQSNVIVAGVPAKIVGKFDVFAKTRMMMDRMSSFDVKRNGKESIGEKITSKAWEDFDKKKNKIHK